MSIRVPNSCPKDPDAFLANAIASGLAPRFGLEIFGASARRLWKADGRDQLVCIYVAKRGVVAFMDQEDFVNASPRARRFGR